MYSRREEPPEGQVPEDEEDHPRNKERLEGRDVTNRISPRQTTHTSIRYEGAVKGHENRATGEHTPPRALKQPYLISGEDPDGRTKHVRQGPTERRQTRRRSHLKKKKKKKGGGGPTR